jgi:CRP-like cAMP-binding protein
MGKNPSYTIVEIAENLRSSTAFEGMPLAVAKRIAELMVMREFKAGEYLRTEGQTNQEQLLLIVAGKVEISNRRPDGGFKQHSMAKSGHILGAVGFIDGMEHSATGRALTDVHVAVLLRDDFVRMFKEDPGSAAQLMAGLLRLMSRRIRHDTQRMLQQDAQILQLQQQLQDQPQKLPA